MLVAYRELLRDLSDLHLRVAQKNLSGLDLETEEILVRGASLVFLEAADYLRF